MAEPKQKSQVRSGKPKLSDSAARSEALRLYFTGRPLGRIAQAVGRPVAELREWFDELDLEALADLGRTELGRLYVQSLQRAVACAGESPSDPAKAREWAAAAKYHSENAARSWRQLEALQAHKKVEPPAITAKPKLVA